MTPEGYGLINTALQATASIESFDIQPVPTEGEDVSIVTIEVTAGGSSETVLDALILARLMRVDENEPLCVIAGQPDLVPFSLTPKGQDQFRIAFTDRNSVANRG